MVSEKNKDGGVVITPSWASEPDPSKVHWRPPVYNAEDYLAGLGGRAGAHSPQQRDNSEMSLRQFESTSDLLAKLATDLRLAYPSFVQEFVTGEGVSLLAETLRSAQAGGARRQALRDELHCLAALQGCLRCPDAARRLAASSTALFAMAACIMSSVNKSRVLALEMLKKTCQEGGHGAVSDALSTMRLRFGEPVRFRFLCGVLGGACPQLLHAGLAFVNAFVESAPSPQARLYLQAELDQAGYSPHQFVKTINSKTPLCEELKTELARWNKMFFDVNKLRARESELSREVTTLKNRLHHLEKKLQILQEEKSASSRAESRLKSRCSALEREVSSLRGGAAGSPAEDEGISSSGHDDPEREPLVYEVYTVDHPIPMDNKQDEETTIEEVMEELQNIINDAETDYKTSSDHRHEHGRRAEPARHYSRLQRSSHDLGHELEIVPDRILPHPPRRSRSLYLDREYRSPLPNALLEPTIYSMFFEDEDSADNSDSALSSPAGTRVAEPMSLPSCDQVRRQQGALLAREAQKSFVKRRETFHNPRPNDHIVKPISPREILPEIKARRGSFDGLFQQNSETGGSSGKNSTKVYIEHRDDDKEYKLHHGAHYIRPTPVKPDDGIRYAADRTVFLPIRNDPSPPSTQKFVVKRGVTNAGLYSGRNPTGRDASCRSGEYYSRSLGNLNHASLAVASGKVTDLPSGLY